MKRNIEKKLLKWKNEEGRKVLLLRGARQVGKTYSIRKLGKNFKHYIEVNFELDQDIGLFFERSLSPKQICEKLSLYYNQPIIPGKTLLFFDEIQVCKNAIKSLRFFYEKMPDLHVIAAGSLLEFAISEISSFGVGRIQSIFMFPLTFDEFLIAKGEENTAKMIRNASFKNPVDPIIHNQLLDKFKIFQIIGGMPEVVEKYISQESIQKCQETIDMILTAYQDDFAKYAVRSPVFRLTEVYRSCVNQAGRKFKYTNIGDSHSESYKKALHLLEKAGLIYRVIHSSARGLPLGAQINPKKFKMILNDTGLYQRILGLDLSDYIKSKMPDIINKGSLAEIYVGIELIAHQFQNTHSNLYYWHREARSSNAEVDYVISIKNQILPVEVKSGIRGQMQSMFIFLKERSLPLGIRISNENFTKYDKIITIPIYAIKTLFEESLRLLYISA